LRATIRHDVLACAIEAIAIGQIIELDYTIEKGRSIRQEVSPWGMVAKDLTIYMPSVTGFSCRIPNDCIDSKRYPLFMAREVMRQLIDNLCITSAVHPGALS
jgi:hypothetical protein